MDPLLLLTLTFVPMRGRQVEAIREQVQAQRDAQVAAQERGGVGTEAILDGQV